MLLDPWLPDADSPTPPATFATDAVTDHLEYPAEALRQRNAGSNP